MTTAKKLLLMLALATGLTLLAASVAFAAGSTIPHGGYDTSSDACLQCHDVHEAGSDYVLLRWQTVTDTCGSCHYLYLGEYPDSSGGSFGQGSFNANPAPGTVPAYNPGYTGDETRAVVATANNLGSRTSAYEVAIGLKDSAPGHNLQRGVGDFAFADGTTNTADYIPGGWDKLTAIQQGAYPNTVNTLNYSGTNGLFCASCHTPHGDFGQQLLKETTTTPVSPKILSGKPNHSTSALRIEDWASQGGKWCEKCHTKRAPEAVDPVTGDIYHNHPDTYCLQCHANSTAGPNTDFPHTGNNANLLSQEPDALCLECHKKGLLP